MHIHTHTCSNHIHTPWFRVAACAQVAIAVLVLLSVALLASTIYSMVKVYIANLRRKGFVLVRDTDSWTLQVSEVDVVGGGSLVWGGLGMRRV